MARLRDIKIGKTVWIKRGTTDIHDFSLSEKEVVEHIGNKYEVDDIGEDDNICAVHAGPLWWPVDWISLTPPKDIGKEILIKEAPEEKLYVAKFAGCTTEIGTIDGVIRELQNGWNISDQEVVEAKFYELTEVNVKYTPAKFEAVE